MTAATEAPPRIATLDIVRGVAVMGILAMNIVAFAMPPAAYMNPLAYGMETSADFVSWLASFILFDGKMRGLFSFLFGASILLVIQRAQAKDEPAKSVHFRRMAWLLVFGLIHYYLIWYGDILTGYALIGMLAWLFRDKQPRGLIKWGIALLVLQLLLMAAMAMGYFAASAAAAAPGADAEVARQWAGMEASFGIPSAQALSETMALYRGSYGGIVTHQLDEGAFIPVFMTLLFGAETLAYMLLGMAALKSGFLKGQWSDARYRKTALIGFGIGIPVYALLAWVLVRDGFNVPMIVAVVWAATVPFRPAMIVATAAFIILLTRGGGALVERIAAAGRAAFTNYLGTSIIMTTVFYGYGLGLFGQLSRAELWLVVAAMWAVMLIWSKPWLDRFAYGPFEWAWRSLSRGKFQPMRKQVTGAIPAAA
ncbi:MAG: DUF418 domain-containing protein [Pseudomonadota bacterium]|nr:DUF418 domain-containing protein [Pseudomonadota bacterium]